MPSGEMKTTQAKSRVGSVVNGVFLSSLIGSTKRRKALYACVCKCGNEFQRDYSGIVNSKTGTCGCEAYLMVSKVMIKHGNSVRSIGQTAEYTTWKAMNSRCSNKNSRDYAWYGAKGIKVCDRWKDFSNFLADMGTRPGKGYSIDRIDPSKNYEPGNCRWITHSENCSRAAKAKWAQRKQENAAKRNGR